MGFMEKIISAYLGRMSQEEKEALIKKAVISLLNDMTPQEKQQLIETLLPKLLEGIDMKSLFPRMMLSMWKRVETEEEKTSVLETMAKVASNTGGKISELLPLKIKKML